MPTYLSDLQLRLGATRPDPHMAVHFGQIAEDVVILHLLAERSFPHPGFYVDVGAHHPFRHSNTFLLHSLGWRGLNIDADATLIAGFAKARPDDVSVCYGVGAAPSSLTLHLFGDGAMNTIDPATHRRYLAIGAKYHGERQVEVQPLAEIMRRHLPAGATVHYLNIDIEGLDIVALGSFDFAAHRPELISIELPGLDLARAETHPAVRFLAERGYRLRSYCVLTAIFAAGR